MLQWEHTAILSTFIELPLIIKIFVLFIIEWPFYTGLTDYVIHGIETVSGLRKHDVAFLVTLRAPGDIGTKYDYNAPFIPQVGLMYVRGCEIEGMLDNEGKVIEEGKYLYQV